MPAIAQPKASHGSSYGPMAAYGSALTQPWQRPLAFLAFTPLRPYRAGTGGALPVVAYALVDAAQRKQGCWRDTQLEAAWVRMREVREQLP